MSDKQWQEVTATPDNVWDRSEPIEGELVKVRENVGPNNSMLYTIKTEDEGEVGVWGSTALDTKMAELHLHDEVRIEPLGKIKSPKTGREYWDFRVSYILGEDTGYGQAKKIAEQFRGGNDKEPELSDDDAPEEEPMNPDDIPF